MLIVLIVSGIGALLSLWWLLRLIYNAGVEEGKRQATGRGKP